VTDASPEYVTRVASALAGAGFPRMPANVLMSLMGASEDALTAEQLAERVGASAAAISGAVRYLEQVGMVRRHRAPGERRYTWELTENSWYTASIRKPDLYDYIIRLSDEENDRLPDGSPARERIEEMRDFLVFVRDALPRLLEEWQEQRRAERAAGDLAADDLAG
jgi:DNA-binding transcriptional regulator GbsR (MarR family)